MSKTLRFGSRTPVFIDRHVTRRRTNLAYDQLMAIDDAARHVWLDAQQSRLAPAAIKHDVVLAARRYRFLNGE